MTDPPTAPLCSLAGRGGERGRKYWILTVRENIAIKLNLLSSLINFKYRLDLTSTTSGRCLTPAVRSQYGGSGTLHRHAPLTTPDWTLGPEQENKTVFSSAESRMPSFIGLSKFSMIVCKFYEDTKMVIILNQSYLQLLSTLSLTLLSSPNIFNIFKARIYLNLIMAFETG